MTILKSEFVVMAQSNVAHLTCCHMNRFTIGNFVCTHKLPIKINDFWVIHWVGGSEPIHVNMQIILERTSIQMIKFEKRKKKRKKGTTLEKECTSASLDVHYFHVSSHYRLLRSTWTHNPQPTTKKGRLPKGCQSKPHLGESNITLPSAAPPQGIQLLWECEPGDDHVMVL